LQQAQWWRAAMSELEPQTLKLHGRSVSYVKAGSGPLLMLIHGIAGSVENWREVIEPLSQRYTVVAPSLPGHGRSAPGAGDYSLGALATGLRDLLVALGYQRATLVGHSLGGGIAMQFAYQFPESTERLALVSSGGLGPEVSAILRAAALPGAHLFIGVTAALGTTVGSKVARGLAVVGLRPTIDVAEVAHGYASLVDRDRRVAFLATLRGVVGTGGQRVSARDRFYLAEGMPVLIIWGERDRIIPLRHAEDAHAAMPGSRLEIFENVGHLPQLEAPRRFITALEQFVGETAASPFDAERWRGRLRIASEQSPEGSRDIRHKDDIAASG
jgi:pimeloyl-ACP methyl ester carboxylesterase